MSEIRTVRLHSDVAIEVMGPIKQRKDDVSTDKDGKLQSITPRWNGKKNRVKIIKGVNEVPVYCLDWPMIKSCIAAKKMTVDTSELSSKEPTKKEALIMEANALGVELTGKETVKQLESKIAKYKDAPSEPSQPDSTELPPVK